MLIVEQWSNLNTFTLFDDSRTWYSKLTVWNWYWLTVMLISDLTVELTHNHYCSFHWFLGWFHRCLIQRIVNIFLWYSSSIFLFEFCEEKWPFLDPALQRHLIPYRFWAPRVPFTTEQSKSKNAMQLQMLSFQCSCMKDQDLAKGSRIRFASLIFNARYGEPPRSGWFANMTVLYLSASFCLEISRSLASTTLYKGYGYFIATMSAASCLVIFSSKPPLGRDFNPCGTLGIAWNRWTARRPTLPCARIRGGLLAWTYDQKYSSYRCASNQNHEWGCLYKLAWL
jgi:hypothetical protein